MSSSVVPPWIASQLYYCSLPKLAEAAVRFVRTIVQIQEVYDPECVGIREMVGTADAKICSRSIMGDVTRATPASVGAYETAD